ncbi:hypothetical protein PBCV1_a012R [Paramecium bursaria Chlorella virus 1]|uniref:Uncharacterized protein n=1 Tax=Paramecium bursaria Chlorella virus 1 TaxID=10506 RepID=Q89347_PBCV1|nr:hypothetical protein PBCV1_a012R [Paramecium bursaria Chlorella virus 1]AAC96380.1 hypothetical protein [Paramecium bursaria Chlorella virus 1]
MGILDILFRWIKWVRSRTFFHSNFKRYFPDEIPETTHDDARGRTRIYVDIIFNRFHCKIAHFLCNVPPDRVIKIIPGDEGVLLSHGDELIQSTGHNV